MKKKALLLLPIIALFGVMAFTFKGTTDYVPAFAEGEEQTSQVVEESSSQPVDETPEEEVTKWKELYEKAQAKLTEMSNYQVLGITLGSIASVLVSLGLSWLMGKVNRDNIRKQGEQLLLSEDHIAKADTLLGKTNDFAVDFKTEALEFKEQAKLIVQKAEEEKDAIVKQNDELKAQITSEREMFLSIISNDKDLVANGTAEKLNKLFANKD